MIGYKAQCVSISDKCYIPIFAFVTLEVFLLFEMEAVIKAMFSMEVRSFDASSERDFLIEERQKIK